MDSSFSRRCSSYALIGTIVFGWAIWPFRPACHTPLIIVLALMLGWRIGGYLIRFDRTKRGTQLLSVNSGFVRLWFFVAMSSTILATSSLFVTARKLGWPPEVGFFDTQAFFIACVMSQLGIEPRVILSIVPQELLLGVSEIIGHRLGETAPFAAPWSAWARSALEIRYSIAAGMGGGLVGAAPVHFVLAFHDRGWRGPSINDDHGSAARTDVRRFDTRQLSSRRVPLMLGTHELHRKAESRHILAAGGTGSGKSQTIRAGVKAARSRGQKALVLDISGELLTRLFRPGIDHIIGAFDGRSESWSPLSEMKAEIDAMRQAAALIAVPESGEAKEWALKARSLTELVLIACFRLHLQGQSITNKSLIDFLTIGDAAELRRIVPHHPALGIFREGNERMLGSVLGVAGTCAQALATLDPEAGFGGWSISEWVAGGERDGGWLYVPVPADRKDSAFPLASLVAGTVIDSVLSLPEDENRRFWLFVDELGQYPAIADLSRALTLGRKFGLSVVAAVQSISQLRSIYSEHGAQTLLSCFTTKLIYRQGDADSADWASREIGDRQLSRILCSGTSSRDFTENSLESWSQQIVTERAVLASELADLPDHATYLISGMMTGVMKVGVPYVRLPAEVTPVFVPADRSASAILSCEASVAAPDDSPERHGPLQLIDQLKNMGALTHEASVARDNEGFD